ncbi:hypothetical protein KLK89_14650 [Clostridioides difficile]|nr:hypothetical protein [Clostridioides difficile]MDK3169753.1 hypothetical protein [Clostridioides difficile]MDN9333076.1 hypothetical protein [Clostridioides difficile]
MFKELLLDNTDRKEFLILKSLYINSGKMNKKDLCKLNNISIPTLSIYIDNIEQDFKSLISDGHMSIHRNKDYISLSFKNNISLDNLMSYYIENSIIFKFFIIILKNDTNTNS